MYYNVKSTRCSKIQENVYLHDHSLQFSTLVGVYYGFIVYDGVRLVCNFLAEQVTTLHNSNKIEKKQIRKITVGWLFLVVNGHWYAFGVTHL